MKRAHEPGREIDALRDRLSRLSEASFRINESLELDAVLQGVLDSARSLAGARYGVMTVLEESGQVEDFLASGLTVEETRQLEEMPGGMDLFEYLRNLSQPLRIADLSAHARSLGLSEFHLPVPVSSFLMVPIRHLGDVVGTIYIAKSRPGEEFTREDEETLVLFASQAALVIANARRHRDEQRARTDLETLVNTSPVGVVVFDVRTGKLASFNREAMRIANNLRKPEQSLEQLVEVATIRRADGREFTLADLLLPQTLRAAETLRVEEIVIEVPDGRSITTLTNATPIPTEGGDVGSFVVTLQDLTPLEDLKRMRAEFLGMVSHELRTPLTSIRGSATAVLDSYSEMDPVELHQFLRIIVDQADHMRDLIASLLDIARVETGTLSVSPEPVDVAVLVDRARNTFLSGGGRDNLDINLASDLPLVMADRRRIVQVIGNLLSNAAKHSPESSVIEVAAVLEGVDVAISVADGGRGISSEQMPRLFRQFSRTEAENRGGDTGLGLAICKGIVEAHGGRIWAESGGPGLGARFIFTIPAVEETVTAPLSPSANSKQPARNESILVVDDDPQTLRYVRSSLSGAGYDPIVTADPGEALRLVVENRPQLVLLDMMLPGLDGIDLMRSIFGIAQVPVIFLSAYNHDQTVAQAFETGAADYIVKPFSPTELVARVRAVLRRQGGSGGTDDLEPYTLGDVTIDYAERLVSIAGQPVQLTTTEYNLLRALSVNAGRVLTHEQLMRQVWGHEHYVETGAVRTVVKRLRRKIGDDASNPSYIFAEHGLGYRMAKSQQPEQTKP